MSTVISRSFVFKRIRLPWRRKPVQTVVTMRLDEADPTRPVLSMNARIKGFQGDAMDMLLKSSATGTDPLLRELCELYDLYNNNDLHAGTDGQEAAIRQALLDGTLASDTYPAVSDYLKSIHLYIDDAVRDAAGRPHRYGHGWVYAAIPEDDLSRIRCLILYGETLPQTTQEQEVTGHGEHGTDAKNPS